METFTLALRWPWLIRAVGRNPLVRTSDRVEGLVLVALVLTALIAVPIACAIGTAVHDSRARAYAAEARDRRPVTAVVLNDATKLTGETYVSATAPARWRVGGTQHDDTIDVPLDAKAGDSVQVWIDAGGSHVGTPTPTGKAAVNGFFAAAASWLAAAGALWLLGAGLRLGLTRRRDTGWDRDLQSLLVS